MNESRSQNGPNHSRIQFAMYGAAFGVCFPILGTCIESYVNIAARVEQNAQPMTVTVTKATADLLPTGRFTVASVGEVSLKGKGPTHLLEVSHG